MDAGMISEAGLAEAALAAGLLDACDRLEEADAALVEHFVRRFSLAEDAARSLARLAQEETQASVDAFDAAHRVNLHTNISARREIVRSLWKLVRDAGLPSNIAKTYVERVAILFEMTGRDAIDLKEG